MSTTDKPRPRASFALIWMPEGDRPTAVHFASVMNASKRLDSDELLESTTDAIRYAASIVHPKLLAPWIKAHFATSPRESVILSPTDIKAAAAKPGKHWTEYA